MAIASYTKIRFICRARCRNAEMRERVARDSEGLLDILY